MLKHFGKNYSFTGIDIGTTYEHLVKTFPEHNWQDGEAVDYSSLHGHLVICADVIEHVDDPSALLDKIKSIQQLQLVVLSTPDRLLARGWFDYGPPKNWTHMREWNGKEFARYIASQGFEIISHQMVSYQNHTQMMICRPVSA